MNYQQLLSLFKETNRELQHKASRSVDTALVIRNWLFGWYIVEFEQGGAAQRTELYGKNLINRLSQELKSIGLKGVSTTSLRQFRTFYLAYAVFLVLSKFCRQCLRNLSVSNSCITRCNRQCLLHLVEINGFPLSRE